MHSATIQTNPVSKTEYVLFQDLCDFRISSAVDIAVMGFANMAAATQCNKILFVESQIRTIRPTLNMMHVQPNTTVKTKNASVFIPALDDCRKFSKFVSLNAIICANRRIFRMPSVYSLPLCSILSKNFGAFALQTPAGLSVTRNERISSDLSFHSAVTLACKTIIRPFNKRNQSAKSQSNDRFFVGSRGGFCSLQKHFWIRAEAAA